MTDRNAWWDDHVLDLHRHTVQKRTNAWTHAILAISPWLALKSRDLRPVLSHFGWNMLKPAAIGLDIAVGHTASDGRLWFWESFLGIITKQRPRICGDPLVIISMADWKLGYGNIPIISPCHRWFFVFFRFSHEFPWEKTVHIAHKNSHSSQFNRIHPNKFFPHFPSCAPPSLVTGRQVDPCGGYRADGPVEGWVICSRGKPPSGEATVYMIVV